MLKDELTNLVHSRLFASLSHNVFAILDGASVPELLKHLRLDSPEYCCLSSGDLAPDLAQTAPYLVRLLPNAPFTRWLLREGWNQHWGIFAVAASDLRQLRTHFRKLLRVKLPDGEQVHFRYYDPRVFHAFIPTCDHDELRFIFGSVRRFIYEHAGKNLLLQYSLQSSGVKRVTVKLGH